MENREAYEKRLVHIIRQLRTAFTLMVIAILAFVVSYLYGDSISHAWEALVTGQHKNVPASAQVEDEGEMFWTPPDLNSIENVVLKRQIEYGRELVMHTSRYLGPKGLVLHISNGMNCQNCHLEAGTKVFGNNYSAVASTYPKFRARSGMTEDIYKRVNDCFERSLNGKGLDTLSREMQAIKAYILFLGSNVKKGEKLNGSGLKDLAYLDRAADPEKGKTVFQAKCISCHMTNGQGQSAPDGLEYLYPPLWGPHSYNDGAGLYRISNFAKYAKYNMPQGTIHTHPLLSDEEAWDVAAYVNTQPRPHLNVPKDWPDLSKKPVDHPFGPYQDSFPEHQHKYGPFKPMIAQAKAHSLK